jgi:hypothetical protein
MKEAVDGIIMVVSCQKHMHTRLREFKLPKDQYDNWKVVYVIGDLFLDKEYEMRDGNYLWIRCEDSYLHLLKKEAVAIKCLYKIYDIKEGVFKCNDDIYFNENNLLKFLRGNKYDYYGHNNYGKNVCLSVEELKKTVNDNFVYDYYVEHPEDFHNPQYNIMGIDFSKYTLRPDSLIQGAGGVMCYLSNMCCKILVKHMENIGYNVLHFDELTQSYPYTLEDCGIAFIMFLNKIPFTYGDFFYSNDYNPNIIGVHTNKYK